MTSSSALPASSKHANGAHAGHSPVAAQFEALRQSLDLPPTAIVGDALHFLIGPDMNVVALLSDAGRLLLLVELADMDRLLAEDWQRLALHLSSHFDDDGMGRLIVLDRKLSMAWSHDGETEPGEWAEAARQAMLWCTGARELLTGVRTSARQ
jgi:hypothetical protein